METPDAGLRMVVGLILVAETCWRPGMSRRIGKPKHHTDLTVTFGYLVIMLATVPALIGSAFDSWRIV